MKTLYACSICGGLFNTIEECEYHENVCPNELDVIEEELNSIKLQIKYIDNQKEELLSKKTELLMRCSKLNELAEIDLYSEVAINEI